jgi:predicted ester cyclase
VNHRALAERWVKEGVAQGNLAAFDELLAEEALDHSTRPPTRGREAFKARVRMIHAALSDVSVSVDDLLEDGDRIAWRWTLEATHTGPLMGVAATGKRVVLPGINIQRIAGGKVIEHWSQADFAGLLVQVRT